MFYLTIIVVCINVACRNSSSKQEEIVTAIIDSVTNSINIKTNIDTNTSDSIFDDADEYPCFPIETPSQFAIQNLKKHLSDETKVSNFKNQGVCFIGFIVDKYGIVKEPKILKGSISPDLDSLIISVMQNLPVWKPAYRKGIPISLRTTIKLQFDGKSFK